MAEALKKVPNPASQVKSSGKNFNDYLVPTPHFTNEKMEAQRRDLTQVTDTLG